MDTNLIRILSVNDHALRHGVASLVNAESDMELIAPASTGREATGRFQLHRPDVIFSLTHCAEDVRRSPSAGTIT